jgi:(R,R)-butanediol dehydrogenase/meso-butanediol dehydrogenase/diacetyl reductase
MRAIRLHGVQDARLDDIPEPTPGPGQVKIRIERSGICGSDLGLYSYMPVPSDLQHPIFNEAGPHVLGHEFAGTVVEIGKEVSKVELGSLVAVRPNVWDGTCDACQRGETNLCENYGFVGIHGGGGGYSEFVVVSEDQVHQMPREVGADAAAMVESTAVAWHAVKMAGAVKGSTALVIGAGPIGLALLLSLRARGAERVIVSEISDSRRALAEQLGAEVLDPRETDPVVYARKSGGGVDMSFDASGVGEVTLLPALQALRPGGTSVVVAQFHSPVPIDPNLILLSEKRVVGSFGYTNEDFAEAAALVSSGEIDPRPLISAVLPLKEAINGGLEYLLGAGRNTEVKMLIAP